MTVRVCRELHQCQHRASNLHSPRSWCFRSKVNIDKSYTPSSLPKTGKRELDELLVIEEEGEEEVNSPFKGVHGLNEKSNEIEEEAKMKQPEMPKTVSKESLSKGSDQMLMKE